MDHAHNEKIKKTNIGRNITVKSRKIRILGEKGTLKVHGNNRSERHQTNRWKKEYFNKHGSAAEIISKGYTPGKYA